MWRAADEPKRVASPAARLMFSVAKAGKDSSRLRLEGAGTGGAAVCGVTVARCGGACWASVVGTTSDGARW